jgi:hypothetical protein
MWSFENLHVKDILEIFVIYHGFKKLLVRVLRAEEWK